MSGTSDGRKWMDLMLVSSRGEKSGICTEPSVPSSVEKEASATSPSPRLKN